MMNFVFNPIIHFNLTKDKIHHVLENERIKPPFLNGKD